MYLGANTMPIKLKLAIEKLFVKYQRSHFMNNFVFIFRLETI